jgi:7,8-dihydropterin-6-yl-methyl-4-(beta-D-ribofuranosyl)aminobenzene 5'-phosphate synthase
LIWRKVVNSGLLLGANWNRAAFMKISIIYDNTCFRRDMRSDWGFSALVEIENTPTILFDTGSNGELLLENMAKLQIDPTSIDEVFISHPHFDHSGGLSRFLSANPKVKIYVPPAFSVRSSREVIVLAESERIHENVFSTGELDRIEQSMGAITEKGVVLIVGCSHPAMRHILDAAGQFGRIYGIIGGLHGFSQFELFKDLQLICPTHCTRHKVELKRLYPQKYVEGGAGRIIEI